LYTKCFICIYLDGPAFGICGQWRSLFDYFAKKW
jgi:hypothetical protein